MPVRRGTRLLALTIAGLAAGILTIYAPPLPISDLMHSAAGAMGMWLGMTAAAACAIVERDRSIAKALALIVACGVAHAIAFPATLMIEGMLNPSLEQHVQTHSLALFVGGSIGASIVSAATFFLYGKRRALTGWKILVCTVGGGVLGAVGDRLGDALPSTMPVALHGMGALYVVWQTGVGLLLGLMWPETATAETPQSRTAASSR